MLFTIAASLDCSIAGLCTAIDVGKLSDKPELSDMAADSFLSRLRLRDVSSFWWIKCKLFIDELG